VKSSTGWEYLVLDAMVVPGVQPIATWWRLMEDTPTQVCEDRFLQHALSELGKEGWILSATGGVHPGTGFGPTRLFLQRMVVVQNDRSPYLSEENEEE
jgi:hypothetical protein